MEYLKNNLHHFKKKHVQFGDGNPNALSWGSKYSQEIRFKQFLRMFDFNGKSVLDVGCGFGDFLSFLKANGVAPSSYTGVDLSEENIKYAKENCTEGNFIAADFLAHPFDQHDIVIMSGTLNLDFSGWERIVKKFVDKMFSLSQLGVGFNMESIWGMDEATKKRLGERNYDPLFWIDYCKRHSNAIIFYHDYLKADYTLGLIKGGI